jgi:hypothetical protein
MYGSDDERRQNEASDLEERAMTPHCTHGSDVHRVVPSALGCDTTPQRGPIPRYA